ncbi:endonuclease/exonuclease/phosphatase family protein [Candidatus Microthrix sp.]|uniref:endonuclease/exonuclease/phosphatase family protein n=1 Tax=Candidatus Neomicrothrix sp. TaxID=2719034 RepID=UPI001B7BCCFA|nr:endonuclease/exonuclease/phosphatase family protein [Candidatus Microthrix sp.]MBK7019084.1 endonuclease/exonuclease/phosphatase family protein [Candidatus Microthrix sp.]MBP6149054.1 endonuclease/exonuclease/phosphatase family protein [Candidatus Microthrix sp.]MBP7404681.1 endonuclease/exonuclease/phosphatase family protein [Candidatus Microthrix sp.]MBP7877666.1 endonuclease/exonuclease/phosphatase family protein [Candidatus Microthrix sp.]MBP7985711.1 endonuclease/exonuclease/phosphatas
MTQRGVFRVACWNIHHGAPGSTWFAKSESLIAGVAQLDADVVVLCEVDHRVWRSRFRNQTQMLAKRLGYHALFAPARRLTPGWYGNALLSRSLPRRTEVLALPARRGAENRSALLTAIPLGGRAVSVAGAHLQNAGRSGSGRIEAIAQLAVVTAAMAARPNPALITGDFNLTEEFVEPAFAGAGLTAVPTGPTYPYPNARRRIDWMGVRGLKVVSSEAVALYGSDHLAITADLMPAGSDGPQPEK